MNYLAHCFGPLSELSARVSTRVPSIRLADTGDSVPAASPDTLQLHGQLLGGGVVTAPIGGVPVGGDGWRMEAYGTEGVLVASTPVMPQISPIQLFGRRGPGPLAQLELPEHPRASVAGLPEGPPRNVARAYRRLARAIQSGERFRPDLDDAVAVQELLDAAWRSSDAGTVVRLVRRG